MITSWTSPETLGMSLAIPVPSFLVKLNSMWLASLQRSMLLGVTLTFRTCQAIPRRVSQVYYEFCVLSRAHYCQGKEGRVKAFQRKHSQLPNSPFCDCNNHQLTNILVVCTILWRCILCRGVCWKFLYRIQNQLIWFSFWKQEHFQVWYLCGICSFHGYAWSLWADSTYST